MSSWQKFIVILKLGTGISQRTKITWNFCLLSEIFASEKKFQTNHILENKISVNPNLKILEF